MDFSDDELAVLQRRRPKTASRWLAPEHHVEVFAVVDHGGGPALGEVRIGASDQAAALDEACALARSASIRSGLLGLAQAGAGLVVVAHPKLDRAAAVQMLRERLSDPSLRVCPSFGLDEEAAELGAGPKAATIASVRGRVLGAWLDAAHAGSRAIVLGADACGRDHAAALVARGSEVQLWDPSPDRAARVAASVGAMPCTGPWIDAESDVLINAQAGPVIDDSNADEIGARVVIGATPRLFTTSAARDRLVARGVTCIPEPFGAVADTLAIAAHAGLLDTDTALQRLASDAREILADPATARDRALDLAIARSRSSRGT